jgi:flagellar motility protein MotE (MotC chaperone)
VVFVAAFAITTWGMIFLNKNFQNIFKFNFNPRTEAPINQVEEPTIPKTEKIDSFAVTTLEDTTELDSPKNNYSKTEKIVIQKIVRDTVIQKIDNPKLLSGIDSLNKVVQKLENEVSEKEKQLESAQNELTSFKESLTASKENKKSYEEWLKTTVDLFEEMDARKASKLIQKYSDNEARDIIYSMRKKNAAEILSYLKPDDVIKITRAK